MNVIVQADHIIPEEMAKIQNQVESRTVKTEMITNETTYSITSKISTTIGQIPLNTIDGLPDMLQATVSGSNILI